MALLDDVKLALRINNTEYDDELTLHINAAKRDLEIAGLLDTNYNDELVKSAIILFVKANFGYEEEAERLQKTYTMIKSHLALDLSYSFYKVTINAGEQCKITFDGETKESNSSGTAVFYTRAKNHVEYSYLNITDYEDITEDTNIGGGS